MILIVDNYDSFTYNIYQYIGGMCREIRVVRNDAFSVEEILAEPPRAIIISPGPGYPKDAGRCVELIRAAAGKIPILGVCLGFQAIVEAMGGKIVPARELMHGKTCSINFDTDCPLFEGLPKVSEAARYHSLAADKDLPKTLTVAASAPDGEIMAVYHYGRKLYGVQFHPESIMTGAGKRILRNFLKIAGIAVPEIAELPKGKETEELKPYLKKVIDLNNLSEDEAFSAMNSIMSGHATNAQIGSFLTALRMKGETTAEITGFARAMRGKALPMEPLSGTIDIVGTGGDLAHTFNISTTSAFVAAAAGARVSKHGNRSVSSLSGSADVLESLGVRIDISPEQALECLKITGLCFMFAPVFHKSMRFAASPRKEIGVRSVFNILGPLANPAKAEYMLLGVYDEAIMEQMAVVLKNLGVKKALVVHGRDGLDEATVTGPTEICEIEAAGGGRIAKYSVSPGDLGLGTARPADLVGGSARDNANITQNILRGEKGPKRDIVLLNSAAALYASGVAEDMKKGVEMAREAIDSGKALKKLEEVAETTNRL
ncbi:MAG: anthranilate phosphoribosyltransferase [Clostridiales bacterium]|jgi:anthranilate synthase/phosphoribosyltransferase|nr:anthranilate phosphoribosyltransferase [Clostridiales bacterium]